MTTARYTITTKGSVTTVLLEPDSVDPTLPRGTWLPLVERNKRRPTKRSAATPKPKRKKKR